MDESQVQYVKDEREANIGASVGRKRIGKSYQAIRMIEKYIAGVSGINTKPRKVLILDVNDEYNQYEPLDINDIARFAAHPKIEARRIRPIFPKTGKILSHDDLKNLLIYSGENFRGGLLLAEDINKYVGDHPKEDITGMFCNNAHGDLDILLHFQAIGRLTPKVWQNLNWIRFFKNQQSVDEHQDKFPERYQMMKIVEIMVNQQYTKGDIRFNVFVDLDSDKIHGDFTKEMFVEAINSYIIINNRSLMRDKKNIFDEKKKKFMERDVSEIFLELRRELYMQYNGNIIKKNK